MGVKRGRAAPGPRGLLLTGSLWWVRRDVLGFLERLRRDYGGVVRARIGHLVFHLVSDPQAIEQVLWRRAARYSRSTRANQRLTDITGASLLTTVGPGWRARRKLIAPAFAPERIAASADLIHDVVERVLDAWPSAGEVDATAACMRLTCAAASSVLFGVAVEDERLEPALDRLLAHHWKRLTDPLELAHRLPTASRRGFREGVAVVDEVIGGLIAERVARGGDGDCFAALASAPASLALSLRDELVTLLIAGHETTANALGWALAALAREPALQERLRAEATTAFAIGIGDDIAARLPLATRVFNEALRLWPPIWLIEREAIEDDELAGFAIPRGTGVIVSPWVLHRAPDLWPDPLRFDPDRFMTMPSTDRFLPFGIGPHACVGASLARLEGPLALAMIARRWRLAPLPRAKAEPQPGLTLRMRRPLRLRLEAWA